MKNIISDISQHQAVKYLRILYPIWFVVGLFSLMYVPSSLIVAGDAITTAKNILANELLFRMGIVGSFLTQLIHIVVVLVLYRLFKSVNKTHAVILVVLGLVGVPIAMLNDLNQFAVLQLLNNPDQMMLFLNLGQQGVIIAGIFWGLWLFPLGFLIYKSDWFPRILGVLMVLAGFGYTLDSFTRFLLPNAAFLPILNLLMYGEVMFMGWLVFKGAKLPAKKS